MPDAKLPPEFLKGALDVAVLAILRDDALSDATKRERLEEIAGRGRYRRETADEAAYLNAWRQKVERIGNANYPDGSVYGDLRLLVVLRYDGALEEVRDERRPAGAEGAAADAGHAAGVIAAGEAVDAGGDGRKRHGGGAQPARLLQRAAVAGGQRLGLALIAAMPDRPDGVDDPPRRERITRRRLRVARVAAAERGAFSRELGAGRAVDRPADPASGAEL